MNKDEQESGSIEVEPKYIQTIDQPSQGPLEKRNRQINLKVVNNIGDSKELRVKLKDMKSGIEVSITNQLAREQVNMNNDAQEKQQFAEYENKLKFNNRIKNIKEVYGDIDIDMNDQANETRNSVFTAKERRKLINPLMKDIKNFDKQLTSKELMQADLMQKYEDQEFQAKAAICMKMRIKKIQKKFETESEKWEEVLKKKKNYVTNKKGYQHMLKDIEDSKIMMTKFKRGLSIFEDKKCRNQFLGKAQMVPVIHEDSLVNNLQKLVLSPLARKNQHDDIFDQINAINAGSSLSTSLAVTAGLNSMRPSLNMSSGARFEHSPRLQGGADILVQNESINYENVIHNDFTSIADSELRQPQSSKRESLEYQTQNSIFPTGGVPPQVFNIDSIQQFPVSGIKTSLESFGTASWVPAKKLKTLEDLDEYKKEIKQAEQSVVFPVNPALFPPKGSKIGRNHKPKAKETQPPMQNSIISNSERGTETIKSMKKVNFEHDINQTYAKSIGSESPTIKLRNNTMRTKNYSKTRYGSEIVPPVFRSITIVGRKNVDPSEKFMLPKLDITHDPDNFKKKCARSNCGTARNQEFEANKNFPHLSNRGQKNYSTQQPTQRKTGKQSHMRLTSMEAYCSKEGIFFNDIERTEHKIGKSRVLYQEYKSSLERGFKDLHVFEEDQKLKDFLSNNYIEKRAKKRLTVVGTRNSNATDRKFGRGGQSTISRLSIKSKTRRSNLDSPATATSRSKQGGLSTSVLDQSPQYNREHEERKTTQTSEFDSESNITRSALSPSTKSPAARFNKKVGIVQFLPGSVDFGSQVKLREIRDTDIKNADKRNFELKKLSQILTKEIDIKMKKTKKTRKGSNPMKKLSKVLDKYKTQRVGTEDQLIQTIKKVNLDKNIMFREKSGVLWRDQEKASQIKWEEMIQKEKQERYEKNQKQKLAYAKVLNYIKSRGQNPIYEEKQVLDGIRIILDNGWILTTDELISYFDVLQFQAKLDELQKNDHFQDFLEKLAIYFNIDQEAILTYLYR